MTINEILKLDNPELTIETTVEISKELLGENIPYVMEGSIEGRNTVVIFNEHFILTVREALTTGCIAKMNRLEEDLFFQFIDYQNGSIVVDVTNIKETKVLAELDKWIKDEIYMYSHPVINACFDSEFVYREN